MIIPGADTDLFNFKLTFDGPEDSPYKGGRFTLNVAMPPQYPHKAPKITFAHKVYHCNINDKGEICAEVYESNWKPTMTLKMVVETLQSLLLSPNTESPLVGEIAQLYNKNRTKHDATAKAWTKSYAKELKVKATTESKESKQ
jgi:ubiquitin-conjugating enzyme E2 D/E